MLQYKIFDIFFLIFMFVSHEKNLWNQFHERIINISCLVIL